MTPPPPDTQGRPQRIQRKRSKGWKMPENTVYVGRPSQWGNEFEVGEGVTPEIAVERFALHMNGYWGYVLGKSGGSKELRDWLKPLQGKNLACWCKPDAPCHADILLEMATAFRAKQSDKEKG